MLLDAEYIAHKKPLAIAEHRIAYKLAREVRLW